MESNIAIPRETYELLVKEDWDSVGRIMEAFAIRRAMSVYGLESPDSFLPKGYTIRDVVSHIVAKAFSGEKKWEPQNVELRPWLMQQVKSVLDDLYNSWESHHEVAYLEAENEEKNTDQNSYSAGKDELHASLTYNMEGAEEILTEKEENEDHQAEAKRFIAALDQEIHGDAELEDLMIALLCVEDSKPRNIAEFLGIPVEKVYTQKRRLERHALRVQRLLEREQHAKA